MEEAMKTLCQFVFAVSLLVGATAAFAAPPKPTADCGLDKDGDGWCVPDPSRTMPDPADPSKSKPFHLGKLDCNDADPAVHPGAKEIVGNGIDEDCDGEDAEAPAYAKNFGCDPKNAKCLAVLAKEIKACDGKTGCAVNYTAGKFVTGFGFYFIDTDCDGVRELVNQAGKDKHDAEIAAGKHCVRPAGTTHRPHHKGKAKPKYAVAPLPVDPTRVDALEKGAGELRDDVDGLDDRLDDVEELAADGAKRLDDLNGALKAEAKAREAADKAEAEARKAADSALGDQIAIVKGQAATAHRVAVAAGTRAEDAASAAAVANSAGVNAGFNVGVALKGQADIHLKSGVARGGFAPMLLVGGHVGAELPSGIYRLLGAVGLPFEEGPSGNTERGMFWTVGGETLFKLAPGSAHALGLIVRYVDHESGGDVLGVNARSRGGGGGVAYEYASGSGWLRTPVHVSLEGGGEQLGSQGSQFRALGNAAFAMLTLTVGGGTGALTR
ncbi:putative metal-binding motif-containing protein [Candidatus Uhrbacteria bacterium]|nr:putative metal-binding motif-containing protein [Candidatus Uhrbacteria bacterium]